MAGARRIAAGERVRVSAPAVSKGPIVGQLLAADDDTITIGLWGAGTLDFSRASVTRLERIARGSQRGRGAKIGGGIGFAIGTAVGLALVSGEYDLDGSCNDCGLAIVALGAVAALPGALVGYAVAPGERWAEEDPTTMCVEPRTAQGPTHRRHVRAGIVPARGGGLGVRLSVGF